VREEEKSGIMTLDKALHDCRVMQKMSKAEKCNSGSIGLLLLREKFKLPFRSGKKREKWRL
jgi:hypothetical protein